ncbi:MAG: hypothetical protein ACKOCM_05675 [Cyanobacteriota bacterium]
MSTDEHPRVHRRYADVESAYTSGNYTEALNQGLALLQDLQDPASKPLRMRLLLLLGHTWLYGLGDLDSAAVAYGQVAEDNEEEALQEIALDGLSRTTPTWTAQDNTQANVAITPETIAGATEPAGRHQAPATRQVTGSEQPGPASPWTTSEPRAQRSEPRRSVSTADNDPAAPWLPAATITDGAGRTATSQAAMREAIPEGTATTDTPVETAESEPRIATRTIQELTEETVVIPSTLSFSPEEEQELAKGLLLVVLN